MKIFCHIFVQQTYARRYMGALYIDKICKICIYTGISWAIFIKQLFRRHERIFFKNPNKYLGLILYTSKDRNHILTKFLEIM